MELRKVTDLASADRAEVNAGDWVKSVTDADEALEMFTQIRAAARAVAELKKHGADRVRRWNTLMLKAERRYGQLLGPSPGAGRPTGTNNVSSGDNISHADRIIRSKARQVAAVDEDVFRDYLYGTASPTRSGLLKAGQPAAQPQARTDDRKEEETMSTGKLLREHAEFDAQVRHMRDQGMGQRAIAAKLGVTFNRIQDSWQRMEGEDRARAALPPAAKRPKDSKTKNWDGRTPTKMLRDAQAAAAKGSYGELLRFKSRVIDAVKVLENYDMIADFPPDLVNMWEMEDILDVLASLDEWLSRAIPATQSWLKENTTRDKIAKMRNVAGRTPEEAANALAMADRWQKRLEARLTSSEGRLTR